MQLKSFVDASMMVASGESFKSMFSLKRSISNCLLISEEGDLNTVELLAELVDFLLDILLLTLSSRFIGTESEW